MHQFLLLSQYETEKREINNFDPRVDSILQEPYPRSIINDPSCNVKSPSKKVIRKKLSRQSADFTTELQSLTEL